MKVIKESLNENISSDELYQDIIQYVEDEINSALDNIVYKVQSEFSNYDPDWAREDFNMETGTAITRLAERVAEDMLKYAPDEIIESFQEDLTTKATEADVDAARYVLRHPKKLTLDQVTQLQKFIKDWEKQNHKESLQEKQWKHQLTVGQDLRQALEGDDYQLMLNLIQSAFREVLSVLDSEDVSEEQYETWYETIQDQIEQTDLIDTEEDTIEDDIDYLLDILYDVCDDIDIWIPFV